MHDQERRQHLSENGGELRVLLGIGFDLRLFAAAQAVEEVIDDFAHQHFR